MCLKFNKFLIIKTYVVSDFLLIPAKVTETTWFPERNLITNPTFK